MPTLTALEYGEDFLYSGCIDLNQEVSKDIGQQELMEDETWVVVVG